MTEPQSPQIEAMQRAMRAAEEAAEKRRLAKLAAREADSGLAQYEDDFDVLAATVVGSLPSDEVLEEVFHLEADDDLDGLLAQLDAQFPDLSDREVDGDLVLFKPQDSAKPWYQTAAEEALPAALRDVAEPLDVKMMLQALLVEMGDVKRTNALLLDHLVRLEEKVDRTNRLLRDRRQG